MELGLNEALLTIFVASVVCYYVVRTGSSVEVPSSSSADAMADSVVTGVARLGFPWQTLWSKQRIASNSAAAFVSCFVPYEAASGKAAAQAVAKSIEIQLAASDDRATVKLTPDGATKQLTVTLDIHGKWTVSR